MVELVKDPDFEELLVGDTDFYGVALGTALFEPGGDEGDVVAATGRARTPVEGVRSPVKVDS